MTSRDSFRKEGRSRKKEKTVYIIDACAGPHIAATKPGDYIKAGIDTRDDAYDWSYIRKDWDIFTITRGTESTMEFINGLTKIK